MKSKIWGYEHIDSQLKHTVPSNIVLVGGCFDIFHYGHHTFLSQAKQKGDFLIIALESDEFIIRHKSRSPVHSQDQRAQILAALEYVDAVVLLSYMPDDSFYEKLVNLIRPAVIAVTAGDAYLKQKSSYAEKFGAQVCEVTSVIPDFSSREIIKKFS